MSKTYQPLIDYFQKIGARAVIRPAQGNIQGPLSLDIETDEQGEFFAIYKSRWLDLEVLDYQTKSRHLLLSVGSVPWNIERFLCGHDEFHWFITGLPSPLMTHTVAQAKESLKPHYVKRLQERKCRGKCPRKTDHFIRQGEWFFTACKNASFDSHNIERDGVLQRNPESKPHQCDYLYREGEREYECDRYPKLAFYESEYREILATRRKANRWGWRLLPDRTTLYAKGWVRHVDHTPIYLDCWHRVDQNREQTRLSIANVRYID
ncbi:Hypothetical protein PBC10988_28170 [Planctomycetales bacterium 10988]|nr:Hypothetical protein PBC10988_28170 [Planctomycetales bacterium 10988]